MSELCECGSAVCWGGCRAAVSTSDVAVLRSERDAALAELNALKLKYDELHDQRHEEARKADAALAEVARVTAERDALETMRTLGWEGMDLKAALSEALAEVARLKQWRTEDLQRVLMLEAENERLVSRSKGADIMSAHYADELDQTRSALSEALAALRDARESLDRYGRHLGGSGILEAADECSCGLDEAIERLDTALRKGEGR